MITEGPGLCLLCSLARWRCSVELFMPMGPADWVRFYITFRGSEGLLVALSFRGF